MDAAVRIAQVIVPVFFIVAVGFFYGRRTRPDMATFNRVVLDVLSPVLVYTTTLIGLMIVVGSGLSLLGLGVQPPAADWGIMVSDGRVVLSKAPHVTIFPGIVIVLVSLAFNFVGDGLREALDTKTRR